MQRLTECGRYRNAIWSPDGKEIMALKYAKGFTELHRLDEWGKLKQVLWKGRRWDVIGGFDWSPLKNELIAAVWRKQGGWNLESFNLDSRQWQYVLKDSAIVGHPQYSHDGRYVVFTSEHGRVYNIRRLDTHTGKFATLTNVLTGASSPSLTPAGDLFYVGYTSAGLDVFQLAREQIKPAPLPKAAQGTTGVPLPTPPVVEPQSVTEYSPWQSLKPAWWMPWWFIDNGRSEWGATTMAYDSLLQHLYAATVAYDTSNDWWLGQLSYIYDGLYPTIIMDVTRNHYFDYEGGKKTRVRRSTEQMLEVVFPFRGMRNSWSFNLAAIKYEAEDVQVLAGTSPDVKITDNVAGAALVYDSARYQIKSISRSQGRTISLVVEDSDTTIGGGDYSGQVYWGDWREFIRLGGQHVLALRYVEGNGSGTTRPFRLGGAKSSESSITSAIDPVFGSPFKKRSYNLRGYPEGLAQLRGQRMRLASAEYRFPLARVERGLMAPPLGIHQIHAAIFHDMGASWNTTSEPEQYYRGSGIEINVDTSLFYFAVVQLSLGYAQGHDEGGEEQVYLRLGAAF
jgi:hypothetical protein